MIEIKKIKKVIISTFIGAVLAIAYPAFVFGKFKYAETTSRYQQALNDPYHLTIIYRKGCSRCKRVVPKLLLEHGLESKKLYVLNAANLNANQLDKLDVHVTPVFRLDKHSHNTVNEKYIQEIWRKSH